jgi:hypothetical protein
MTRVTTIITLKHRRSTRTEPRYNRPRIITERVQIIRRSQESCLAALRVKKPLLRLARAVAASVREVVALRSASAR